MRVRGLLASGVCFAVLGTSALFAFDEPLMSTLAEGVTLPVVLKQKIDTAKVRQGDMVQFELLSPVLANQTVVVPASAKIYGRILEAHPLEKHRFSSLAVVIESIVWKRQRLALHAHLAGFGRMKVTYYGKKGSCEQNLSDVFRVPPRTGLGRNEPTRQTNTPAPKSVYSETQCESIEASTETDPQKVAYIRLYRTNSPLVPVAFGSTKRNIVLKKGTLLIIRNGAEPVTMGAASNGNKFPHQ
jgi:hypothetical protein